MLCRKVHDVDAFMVGATQFYKPDMYYNILLNGQHGHGPVVAAIDRNLWTQVLGVTEMKNKFHTQGLAQNRVRLDVAVHQKKRKREEEADDIGERVPIYFKSYGIVTDSLKWGVHLGEWHSGPGLTPKSSPLSEDAERRATESKTSQRLRCCCCCRRQESGAKSDRCSVPRPSNQRVSKIYKSTSLA